MDIRAIGMGVFFAVMWASAFTSTRMIVTEAPPLFALALRFAMSGAAAFVVALMGVGQLIGVLPAGAIVARIGERGTLWRAGVLDVVALALAGWAPSLWLMAVALLLSGFASSAFFLARQGFMIDVLPPDRLARGMSLLGGSLRTGLLLGPAIGSLAIGPMGLQGAYSVAVVMALASLVVVLASPDLTGEHERVRAQEAHSGVFTVIRRHLRLLLTLGLAIKVPVWPLHSWLPLAHTTAPTAGSMLLAAVLLKMGTYGFVRIAMPILPEAWRAWAWAIVVIGIVSVLYGAFVALAQTNLKRMIAYTSVNHMGYIVLALGAVGLVVGAAHLVGVGERGGEGGRGLLLARAGLLAQQGAHRQPRIMAPGHARQIVERGDQRQPRHRPVRRDVTGDAAADTATDHIDSDAAVRRGHHVVERQRIGLHRRGCGRAVAGAVAAIGQQVDAMSGEAAREVGSVAFDALGIAAEVQQRPPVFGPDAPAAQCGVVALEYEIRGRGRQTGGARHVQQLALAQQHRHAQRGVAQRCGQQRECEQAHPQRGGCARCAASNSASCSGVAAFWCIAFHCANGMP